MIRKNYRHHKEHAFPFSKHDQALDLLKRVILVNNEFIVCLRNCFLKDSKNVKKQEHQKHHLSLIENFEAYDI